MAKSRNRKEQKQKAVSRNNQKLQEKAHQKHRLNKMIEQMIKAEQEKKANESSDTITDVVETPIIVTEQ